MAAGLVWSWGYETLVYNAARSLDGKRETIQARITDYSQYWRYGHRADARISVDGRSISTRIYYYGETELKPGDEIEAECELSLTDTIGEDATYSIISQGYLLYGFAKGNITVPVTATVPFICRKRSPRQWWRRSASCSTVTLARF